jgi:tetratricopeptide (TPR) repeat protein
MNRPNLDDTQPTVVNKKSPVTDPGQTQPIKPIATVSDEPRRKFIWLWIAASIVLLSLAAACGGVAGYRNGTQEITQLRQDKSTQAIDEQFNLGIADLQEGRYEIARQRFQYVFEQNPDYPGLTERMAEVLTILYATQTPTPVTPTATITLTPTPDLRPAQERFDEAVNRLQNGEWSQTIDLLLELRKDEPDFQQTRVDGMLYLALRQRGVDKIYKQSDLEGGIYDLSLAENFGPIDVEAEVARNMARLYLYGSSFWEAYPEKAVYYFGQVASAMPYLRDGSGWTATERYRGALIQYGDQLAAKDDWCNALEQYQAAAAIRSDAALDKKIDQATEGCYPPTATEVILPTTTFTMTPTPTGILVTTTSIPPTATKPVVTPTATSIPPTSPPPTSPAPTDTPTPTNPPPPPTDTPVPPTDVPTPTATATQPAP